MAMNNFMHPRNIYKTPPDFAKLATTYPEFSSITKTDVSGKVTVDFKDPKSLRILTRCLLKSDFNVDIDIPDNRLVPTLPLRLNYILWIEDILTSIKRHDNIRGVDIGTGACAIYPVLAATKNKWFMIGTETDEESVQKAQKNIENNNLQNIIKIRKNSSSSTISHILASEKDQMFDFCMCNPPFYSSVQDLCESRNPTRELPKNAFTGSPQELITEGGELTFCRKLIEESNTYKDRVRVYTTMIGHKYNLKELIQDLEAEGIEFTHTEFCQGRVTRWGLAWTHQNYEIYKLVPPREKLRKKNTTIAYLLPELSESPYNVDACSSKLKGILQSLDIEYKIINKRGNNFAMQITAFRNTWSNQRRKRRLLKMLQKNECKKIKLSESGNTELLDTNNVSSTVNTPINNNNAELSHNNNGEKCGIQDEHTRDPIVQAFLKLYKKNDNILFEVEYLSGSAGKEGLHQVVQYIKNNWK